MFDVCRCARMNVLHSFFIVALLVPPRYALFFISYQELDQEGLGDQAKWLLLD